MYHPQGPDMLHMDYKIAILCWAALKCKIIPSSILISSYYILMIVLYVPLIVPLEVESEPTEELLPDIPPLKSRIDVKLPSKNVPLDGFTPPEESELPLDDIVLIFQRESCEYEADVRVVSSVIKGDTDRYSAPIDQIPGQLQNVPISVCYSRRHKDLVSTSQMKVLGSVFFLAVDGNRFIVFSYYPHTFPHFFIHCSYLHLLTALIILFCPIFVYPLSINGQRLVVPFLALYHCVLGDARWMVS